jgi:hypothetical protein
LDKFIKLVSPNGSMLRSPSSHIWFFILSEEATSASVRTNEVCDINLSFIRTWLEVPGCIQPKVEWWVGTHRWRGFRTLVVLPFCIKEPSTICNKKPPAQLNQSPIVFSQCSGNWTIR